MLKHSINWDYQWGQIVGRAWADSDFTQRLLADPAGVLTEYDLSPPEGVRIAVLEDPEQVPEDTDGIMHLVLPGKPSAAELCEDELRSLGSAVAVDRCGCGGCGCRGCGGCGGCVWCYNPPGPGEN